ncbi:hypothetical protein H0H81_008574 [Sphagnurus paluster]|uniref:Uncharacterized protein n=1 Tax=Sphagnurus paluster TaxID=117069 RepID=A0A9P7GVW6_9AGAR|nr:hypothetical protein H0H81_008574 [Sphagnurus paluster]
MVAPGLLFSVLLAGSSAVQASPSLLTRQSISFLSASQIAAYRPYTYYASAAYCKPTNTLAWNCGAQCQRNPSFQPVASGGDGAATRYWYVGYDPTLNSVIVAFEGADPSETLVRTTDDAFLTPLDAKLFPGISRSLKVDEGFQNDHARSDSASFITVSFVKE